MDELFQSAVLPKPTETRPLLGLTVLAVEDSRFACEALRLLCLRSGARIRRADCLTSARRHLKVYRPSVLIVDVGLPDGSGIDLIAEAAASSPRIAVILGSSGDDTQASAAVLAGADGFLAKPVVSLAEFQETVLSHLPDTRQPKGPRRLPHDVVQPDQIAFQDDMLHLSSVLSDLGNLSLVDYAARFAAGVALTADDEALLDAAKAVSSEVERAPASVATSSAVHDFADLVAMRIDRQMAI
ncbi:response regulator [Pseudaestuariivita atlantica]|uniref:Response regulator n=1 Tax=Pseudaestuariivita atlantica TaxID=1317121 RepID=A0A0L1JQB5_9RHOB|nr:response regulator [Pseudaestuariivita atlantica]KNG93613.1 response regulator [Pseudaestuariivita atlantica]